MKKLHFICTFESDIVLHASSNTEGKIEKLDYIPGSNFLGMVARDYKDFGADAFDVFHSGKVCFSDGHILENGETTLAMPFSFQAYKGISFEKAIEEKKLFVHHHLTEKDFDDAINEKTQIKQQRKGFFTPSGKLANYSHSYRQKSAYDKNKRRSRDSHMFGYYALPSETKWAFTVSIDENMLEYGEKIKDLLTSATKLGKSKSVEYGRVKIEYIKETENSPQTIELQTINDEQKYLYLYAKSRLALTDSHGVNSYTPSIESLGFDKNDNVHIDWNKSQIRTSRYTPYVRARKNFDPERLTIEKGSVVVVRVSNGFDISVFQERINKPIGLYTSEGHGEVIVNPPWLLSKDVNFTPNVTTQNSNNSNNTPSYDNTLNKWLISQREQQDRELKLLEDVQQFITDNPGVKHKKSQWGQIRSRCRSVKNNSQIYDSLFSETMENGHKKGFLLHGKAKEKWDNKLVEKFKSKYLPNESEGTDYLNFVKLLSIYAPKEDNRGEKHV